MIAQVTAAALVSENKILAHPASVDSIPSSAGREDHVSMGATAALKLAHDRRSRAHRARDRAAVRARRASICAGRSPRRSRSRRSTPRSARSVPAMMVDRPLVARHRRGARADRRRHAARRRPRGRCPGLSASLALVGWIGRRWTASATSALYGPRRARLGVPRGRSISPGPRPISCAIAYDAGYARIFDCGSADAVLRARHAARVRTHRARRAACAATQARLRR